MAIVVHVDVDGVDEGVGVEMTTHTIWARTV